MAIFKSFNRESYGSNPNPIKSFFIFFFSYYRNCGMTTIGLLSYDRFFVYLIFYDIKSCFAAFKDFFYLLGFMFFFIIYSINWDGIYANVFLASGISPFSLLNLFSFIKSTMSLSQASPFFVFKFYLSESNSLIS